MVSELLTHDIREVKHFATGLDSSHNLQDLLSQYGSEGIKMHLSKMLPEWVKQHTREELTKHLRNSTFSILAERHVVKKNCYNIYSGTCIWSNSTIIYYTFNDHAMSITYIQQGEVWCAESSSKSDIYMYVFNMQWSTACYLSFIQLPVRDFQNQLIEGLVQFAPSNEFAMDISFGSPGCSTILAWRFRKVWNNHFMQLLHMLRQVILIIIHKIMRHLFFYYV